jgi:hypothetical protein
MAHDKYVGHWTRPVLKVSQSYGRLQALLLQTRLHYELCTSSCKQYILFWTLYIALSVYTHSAAHWCSSWDSFLLTGLTLPPSYTWWWKQLNSEMSCLQVRTSTDSGQNNSYVCCITPLYSHLISDVSKTCCTLAKTFRYIFEAKYGNLILTHYNTDCCFVFILLG